MAPTVDAYSSNFWPNFNAIRPLVKVQELEEPQIPFTDSFGGSFVKGPKKREIWTEIAKELEPPVSIGFYISLS